MIINGELESQLESGMARPSEIIIPQVVLDELQSQAVSGRGRGTMGLEKLDRIYHISEESGIAISCKGDHISTADISLADSGRADALVIDMARDCDATLYTSDVIQHMTAKSQRVGTVLVRDTAKPDTSLEFLKFFADADIMSVHLKEQHIPLAKRGGPGAVSMAELGSEPLERKYLEMVAHQIADAVRSSEQSTVEISKEGAMVFQHEDYRIAVTRPPFSDTMEITIVHPITKMSIRDYNVSDALMSRFEKQAEGIIISGPPGSGKSTLASGLGNFYHSNKKIVKTFESPRDLQVDRGITQYGKLDDSFENSADVLLLVRPDYTIFDEVRRKEDFEVFADLRMTGVGMIGVVHANTPIDAIQRFIGKIELGMIPSILDTVIFVKGGMIDAVYDLNLEVKVPAGMTESDLARPVIVVKDFESSKPMYEVYTFGEENVIVPVSAASMAAGGLANKNRSGVFELAAQKIRDAVRRYDRRAEVRIVSDQKALIIVSKRHKARIIGKRGSNIDDLQRQLGIRLDVRTPDEIPDEDNHEAGADAPYKMTSQRVRAGDDGGDGTGLGAAGGRYGDYGRGGSEYDDDDDDTDHGNPARAGRRRYGRRSYDDYDDGYDDDMYDTEQGDAGDAGEATSYTGSDAGAMHFSIKSNRNLVYIDVGRKYGSKNIEVLDAQNRQVATAWVNKKGVAKLSTRTRGGRAILDADSPTQDITVRILSE